LLGAAIGATLAAAPVAVAVATAGPAAAADTGTVFVVHGVPGLNVDVYVDKKEVLSNFKPASVAGPLSLPAGTHDVAIRKAGAPATSTPAIEKSATLPAGANVSLVAHLTAAGTPTLTPFVNPVTGLASGKARLVVRHTAAAPAVDVLANGKPVFTNVTNPQQRSADLAPGTVSAAVALAGTTKPVIGPASLTLEAGKVSVVYAIGSAKDKTLQLVTQSLPATAKGQTLPQGANAGSGGLAADRGNPALAVTLVVTGLVLAGAGATVLVVRARS
jgi:hypothetical protein